MTNQNVIEFPVEGMTCASCVNRVETALAAVPGVHKASVNLITEKATVESDGVSPRALAEAVKQAGYRARLAAPQAAPAAVEPWADALRRDLLVSLAFSVPLLVLGMSHGLVPAFASPVGRLVQWLLATLVVFGPGRRFFKLAFTALRHRTADMNTLVSLGVAASYGWSTVAVAAPQLFPHAAHGHPPDLYFEAARAIVTFILLR